jgi:uncharacterized protein YlxW (UPF0749 family)
VILADISLNGFGAVVVVVITVLTIGLGAVGIFMQRRNAAVIGTLKDELELSDRKRGELTAEVSALTTANNHLNHRVDDLSELVTQAAKVDALRGEMRDGFALVLARLPA